MKPSHYMRRLAFALALFIGIAITACGGGGDESATPPVVRDASACTTGPGQTPVDTTFCRGKANFNDRTLAGLGGNGRACVDCHMESESFQLSPASADQSAVSWVPLTY